MKKLAVFLCLVFSLFSIVGCSPTTYKMVCPDGAPAIACYALKTEEDLDITVYPSSMAASQISKQINDNTVDFAIMPVNLASKLCANGNNYKMAGVLTHGNLYGVSNSNIATTDLRGKKVGVIQLSAVPGYTFKLLLSSLSIPYTEDISEHNESNVYLFQISADAVAVRNALASSTADVCIVAEPMCSKLVSAFSLNKCIDIQNEYGSFPQAVLMVKSSLISSKPNVVKNVASKFESFDYLSINATDMVDWINDKMPDGASTSLSVSALTQTALENSNIYFSYAQTEKQKVKNYLLDLKTFDTLLGTVANEVGEEFFWRNV